jgi:hypothetical protein
MVVLVTRCATARGIEAMRVETETGKDPRPDAGGPDALAARLVGPLDALCTSFHVALDTMDARRLRADPHLVSIPGFVLLDTGDYEPVLALVSLELFWRMQGMDILAYTRAVNRERRASPRTLPTSGSVWLVEGTLDANPKQAPGEHATQSKSNGPPPRETRRLAPCLRICAVRALDRVSIERRGPRHIETIDVQTMLPRFTEKA